MKTVHVRTTMVAGLIVLLGTFSACEESTTDPDDDNGNGNGSDSEYLAEDGLTKTDTKFTLEVNVDNDNDGTPDRTDTNWVTIGDREASYGGKMDVIPYSMVAGFVTDDIFHGVVAIESDGHLSVSPRVYVSQEYWVYTGWMPYPVSGPVSFVETLRDSVSTSGNRREVITWEAERTGTTTYEFEGTTYDAILIEHSFKVVRTDNPSSPSTRSYERKATDTWVPDLGFAVKRESEIIIDDTSFGLRTSHLITIEEI